MAKKKTVDPLALVSAAAKGKEKKKSKSKTPIIEVTDEKVGAAMVGWKDAKEREKDANAERKMLEEVILPLGVEERRDLIQGTKEHVTSVKLKTDDVTITMKTSKAYSAISPDIEDDLEEIFGDDYERLFVTHTAIQFKEAFTSDPETLQKVIEAVGADRFAEVFDVTQTIKPTDVLIVERDANKKVAAMHDKAVEQGLLKPFKPAFTL